MKAKIISKQGPYRFADGSIATISGRAQPLTTYAQAQALADVWIKVASDLFEKLRKAGKADKAGPLTTAVAQFHMRQADWFLWMNDTYGSNRSKFKGKYLFLPAADKFYQNLGFFISHVNSAANSALAARTAWELLGEAINETSGGFLIKPFYYGVQGTAAAIDIAKKMAAGAPEFFNDIGSGIETIITMMKWGSVAGGLYLLYGALKPEKSK